MSFSLYQSDCDKFQPISSRLTCSICLFFRAVSIFNSLLMLIRLIIDKQLFMVSRKHIGREKVSRSEMSTNWWTWYQVRWGRNIDLICGKSSKFQEIHGFIGWAGKSINFDFFQQFAISTPCHYFFFVRLMSSNCT